MKTSVKYMVIYRHKGKYSISEMCKFFQVSRSGYYGYVARMDTPASDLPLAEKIRDCQEQCVKHTDIAEYIYGLKEMVFIAILKQYYGLCRNTASSR